MLEEIGIICLNIGVWLCERTELCRALAFKYLCGAGLESCTLGTKMMDSWLLCADFKWNSRIKGRKMGARVSKEGNSQFSCLEFTIDVWWNTTAYWEEKQKQKYNNGGKRTRRIGWEYVQKKLWQPLVMQREREVMRVDGKLIWIALGVIKFKFTAAGEVDLQRCGASPDTPSGPQNWGPVVFVFPGVLRSAF